MATENTFTFTVTLSESDYRMLRHLAVFHQDDPYVDIDYDAVASLVLTEALRRWTLMTERAGKELFNPGKTSLAAMVSAQSAK